MGNILLNFVCLHMNKSSCLPFQTKYVQSVQSVVCNGQWLLQDQKNILSTKYSDCIGDLHRLQRESKVTDPEIETFTKGIHNLDEFPLFFLIRKQSTLGRNWPMSGTLIAFPELGNMVDSYGKQMYFYKLWPKI